MTRALLTISVSSFARSSGIVPTQMPPALNTASQQAAAIADEEQRARDELARLTDASAQAGLRSYLRMVDDLGQVVTLLNQDLSERIDDGRFLTLLLGILEADGSLRVVNGGHVDPMIWRASSGEVETLTGGGPALGMIDDFDYEVSGQAKLEPGDVLVVFTDGFSEARDPKDHAHMLGEDGVAAELKAAAAEGLGAREITGRLVKVALEICRDLREDDMTLIVLRNPS